MLALLVRCVLYLYQLAILYQQFAYFLIPNSPITTYHGRATTKPGINPKAYTIIYTGRTAPKKLPQEKIHKDPIQVTEKDDAQSLDPLSRVNLGISYVIAWDVKVVEIGQVRGTSLRLLTNYREMVKEDVFGLE